ncbi:MAG: PQQ-binding-like beta-propeller repeat protein [Acidobacteria bacterium]|nr:PQQ-binding-like beta-propeller repeat protein [Acidobacteriota bacterium]
MTLRSTAFSLLVALCLSCCAFAQVAVLTQHNDNYRTGQNTGETILTPANVTTAKFGKLFSQTVDGYVYAQPLVVPNVNIPGKGTHNVVYVATEHDTLYAFDADNKTGGNASPLWQVSFLNPGAGIGVVTSGDVGCNDLVPEIGITGTPAIDLSTQTLYLVTKTKDNGQFVHKVHAIDITTGAEKFGGPVAVQATLKGVAFEPHREAQRAALLVQNGVVYIAWASHCDIGPYHGWVMAYDAQTLQQKSVWNSTPTGGLGGFWQAGAGIAADSRDLLYLSSGNGDFDKNFGGSNYGDTIVKLGFNKAGKLIAKDYFTPHDQKFLQDTDTDLGSGGVLLIPDRPKKKPLLVQVGKEGTVYVTNRNRMGKFNPNDDSQIIQNLPGAVGGMWGMPAFWNNNVYFGGVGDNLKAFSFDPVAGLLSTTPTSNTGTFFNYPGTTPSISANGTTNGIVWALQTDHAPEVLHAYDATNLSTELYNSSQNQTRDNPGTSVKFVVPTVANGKVYVPAQKLLSVFGLL